MNTDHKLTEAVLPRLTPGMTQAQRLAQIDAALRRMQQTLAYMFAHLTAENISPKGLCDVILAPRDEKTGALWHFTDGHIFCGEKQII